MALSERVSAAFAAYLVGPYLLTVPPSGYAEISNWKYYWFIGGTIVYLCLMIACLTFGRVDKQLSGASQWGNTISLYAVLAYMLFSVLSAVCSIYPGVWVGHERYDGALTIAMYAFTALFLMRYLQPKVWMLQVFGASISLMCLLGIAQLTGSNPLWLFPDGYNYYGAGAKYAGEFWGTIGNTDLCASVLSLATGLFIGAMSRCKRNWIYAVPVTLCVFSLVEIHVEAGLLALLAGFALLPPVLVKDRKTLFKLLCAYGIAAIGAGFGKLLDFYDGGVRLGWSATVAVLLGIAAALIAIGYLVPKTGFLLKISAVRLRRKLFVSCIGIIACTLIMLYFAPTLPDGFLSQAHGLLHGELDDALGSGRIYIWKQVWSAIRKKPLLGGGPDTLSLRGLEGFSRYDEILGTVIVARIDAAHNEFLNIWVNQGLLALIAYLALLVTSAMHCWREQECDAIAICGAGALCYLVQSLFGIAFCSVTIYLWIALAVINGAYTSK